jgi:DivIVA domain-containing protein
VRLPDWPVVVLLLLMVAVGTVALLRRSGAGPGAVGAGGPGGGEAGSPVPRAAGDAERFRPSGRFASGYRRDEVDAFFARVDSGRVTVQEIEGVVFGSTIGRDGYDEREVDEALDRAVERLRGAS